jgi:hypothetical protein
MGLGANFLLHIAGDCFSASVRTKKKERRRLRGHPSSMSLSEEGSSVFCIAFQAGKRSTLLQFFVWNFRQTKGE